LACFAGWGPPKLRLVGRKIKTVKTELTGGGKLSGLCIRFGVESRHSLKAPEWRQCAKELDPNTLILGAELLGRKRGIFALAAYAIVKEGSAMNMLAPSQPQEITRSRRIGFLIYPDCEICDVCGPFDVFHWADYWLPRFGRTDEPGYQLIILAATPGPVRTLGGIELVATHSFCDIGHGLDTLLVAGGCLSVDQACKDPSLVEWVRSAGPRVRRVASICTGALILAAAGLLDHRRVTTHWMFSDMLASAYPSIQVDPSLFFARDGNIYTSGGVTAGIDLAMALVEEDLGQEIALAVARTMVVFPQRSGGQSQFRSFLMAGAKNRPDIRELQGWILGHPREDLSVPALADRMAMSPRNFARLFRGETGQTPAEFVERARADAARAKLQQTLLPVDTIAEECGFGYAERMRRTFQRLFDVSPHDYRALFRSTLFT
jgi:transcriptional regulator GlxA family with amidase domain